MTTPPPFAEAKDDLRVDLREARRHARLAGKSLAAQAIEFARLRSGLGRIRLQEYYGYRLYDDQRFTWGAKQRFIGLRTQYDFTRRCLDKSWWALAHDKLAFHTMMRANGLPVPRILATYHPVRTLPPATALHSRADVERYLRTGATYPFFSKPVDGMFSLGTARIDAYDAAADALLDHRGRAIPLPAFVEAVERYAQRGYVFEELRHPHPRVRALCGDRLATVRVMLLVGAAGPELFRTVWKIPAGEHVADNFWRRGNLLAALDPATGRVTRVVTGVGYLQREVMQHPDTGQPLTGVELPCWEQVTALALAAAIPFAGIRFQAWDIAIDETGAVAIEVNIGGDYSLPQMATGAGILDARFRAFLAELGYV